MRAVSGQDSDKQRQTSSNFHDSTIHHTPHTDKHSVTTRNNTIKVVMRPSSSPLVVVTRLGWCLVAGRQAVSASVQSVPAVTARASRLHRDRNTDGTGRLACDPVSGRHLQCQATQHSRHFNIYSQSFFTFLLCTDSDEGAVT